LFYLFAHSPGPLPAGKGEILAKKGAFGIEHPERTFFRYINPSEKYFNSESERHG
jgi:hypothetical protein